MRDRGVDRDIYSRNDRKQNGLPGVSDKVKVLDAVTAALERGAKNLRFLGSIRLRVRRGCGLTAKQLTCLNDCLERVGMSRISVPVYDAARKKRRWEAFKTDTNERFEALKASRPSKPPARTIAED